MSRKIFYFVPDNSIPSWGIGIIFNHVSSLVKAGYDAYVLFKSQNTEFKWLNLEVPIASLKTIVPCADDILVVPEFMAAESFIKELKSKKIVFVQGLSLLFVGFHSKISHIKLGYKEAIVIMPHMTKVVLNYTKLPTRIVPPFIAEYFFKPISRLHEREKIILIFPKLQQFEYSLIRMIIQSEEKIKSDNLLSRIKDNWRIIELSGYTHLEVADLMSRSMFLITTNTFEAFNTAVPEAMASGCINICYEAVGPADYLRNGENAFVFQNNNAIELAEKVIELVTNFDQYEHDLANMRAKAYETALVYTKEKMETELLNFFSTIS